MPTPIANLLDSPRFHLFARIVLTFVFWGAGLAKLIDFQGGTAEMAFYGLEPAALINGFAAATLLTGSALVILNRQVWLGCGMLAVFTGLTIPLVHHFWSMDGEAAIAHFHTATEHVSVIGALMVMAILSRRKAGASAGLDAAAPTLAEGRAA